MEFFTHIAINPFAEKIDHSAKIFSIGSCFAQNMAERLKCAKFHTTSSPTGILFNPESIAASIERMASGRGIAEEELHHANGHWFSYDFHSSFSAADKQQALNAMQSALSKGAEALKQADTIIVTFGTAWVYRLGESGTVVANCHKQPQSLFQRTMLSAEDIATRWSELMNTALKGKRVIFTVSPIRHLGDGLEQNSLSKATLRVAIAEIIGRTENASYFPSFEIMNDELRDYRFYAEDMVHPSPLAIDYIWQRFSQVAFSAETLELIKRLEKISRAASHRPFDSQSESHKLFCRKQLGEIEDILRHYPTLDFSEEKESFVAHL